MTINKHVAKSALQLYLHAIKKKPKLGVILTDKEKENFKPQPAAWRQVIHWLPKE